MKVLATAVKEPPATPARRHCLSHHQHQHDDADDDDDDGDGDDYGDDFYQSGWMRLMMMSMAVLS